MPPLGLTEAATTASIGAGDLEVVDVAADGEVAPDVLARHDPGRLAGRIVRLVGDHVAADGEVLDLDARRDRRVEHGDRAVRADVRTLSDGPLRAVDQDAGPDRAVEDAVDDVEPLDVLAGHEVQRTDAADVGPAAEDLEVAQGQADGDVVQPLAVRRTQ